MKRLILTSSLLLSCVGFAQSPASSEQALAKQHQVAMTEFTAQVKESNFLAASDVGCPVAGSKIVNGQKTDTGTLLSAKGILKKLAIPAAAENKALAAQNNCGSCRQTIATTSFVVTRPAKVALKAFCDNRPTSTFMADFQTEKDAQEYTEEILNKKNAEGQRLYAACPDPCAFSVYAGKQVLSNGKVRSTLTVNCGQPRNTSPLFAKYNYSYGTTVQWSCHK